MQWLNDKIEAETEESEFPIVMLSATEGYNKQVFLQTVSQMVAQSLGKTQVELKYPAWQHNERVDWLFKFANVNDPGNFIVDEQGQEITITCMLDSAIYMKWLKTFEPETFEKLNEYHHVM